MKNGHVRKIFAKKEVILSAGVFNTPQLLMLSGIGPHDELQKFRVCLNGVFYCNGCAPSN